MTYDRQLGSQPRPRSARDGLGRVRAMSADYARSRRTLAQVNAMAAERGGEAPAHLLRVRDAMTARLAACEDAWDALGPALERVASSCCPRPPPRSCA